MKIVSVEEKYNRLLAYIYENEELIRAYDTLSFKDKVMGLVVLAVDSIVMYLSHSIAQVAKKKKAIITKNGSAR